MANDGAPMMDAKKVDVLAVIDKAIVLLDVNWPNTAIDMREARAAVAELIKSADEYRTGTKCHVCDCIYCHDRSIRLDNILSRIGAPA